MKKSFSIHCVSFSVVLLSLAACGSHGKHISGTGEDFRRVEFADVLTDTTLSADILAEQMGGAITPHADNIMPMDGKPYIEQESGDRWTIHFSGSPDSIGYATLSYRESSGSTTTNQTKMQPRGHGFFVVDDVIGNGWVGTGALLYVYASRDSIGISDGVHRRTFVTADVLSALADTIRTPQCSDVGRSQARSAWVKDGDQLLYIDASGNVMKDNWTPDGFYADNEGHWDPYTPSLEKNLLADGFYTWHNWGSSQGKQMTFELKRDADGVLRGNALHSIRMVKDQEQLEHYLVTATGNSTYLLVKADDDTVRYHATITDEGIPGKGRQMFLSGYGKTEHYE